MRTLARRHAPLLLLLLIAALIAPGSSGASPAPDAHAAKLKKCKPGLNAKKCRCPAGKKLVKQGHKYRCKKKSVPQQQGQQDQGNGNTQGNTDGTNTDPGAGTGTGAPPAQTNGAQTERDDAGYTAALASSRFGPRNDEGSSGYSTHTYDFCQNGTFSYHYEYVGVGNGEAYYNGSWQVEQGYRVIQSQYGPGWAGILIMTENDGKKARIEVDFNDSAGAFYVGTGSDFTGGQFQRSAPTC